MVLLLSEQQLLELLSVDFLLLLDGFLLLDEVFDDAVFAEEVTLLADEGLFGLLETESAALKWLLAVLTDSLGDCPVTFLNVRLNVALLLNPASKAIPMSDSSFAFPIFKDSFTELTL